MFTEVNIKTLIKTNRETCNWSLDAFISNGYSNKPEKKTNECVGIDLPICLYMLPS